MRQQSSNTFCTLTLTEIDKNAVKNDFSVSSNIFLLVSTVISSNNSAIQTRSHQRQHGAQTVLQLCTAVYMHKAFPAGQLLEFYSTFSCDRSNSIRQDNVSGVSSYVVFHSGELFKLMISFNDIVCLPNI